ncbi:MAG: hypothetical protein GY850_17350 [bacterium]|nr:hypothetical protein [bacterium]
MFRSPGPGICTGRIKDDSNCKRCGNCEKYCPPTAMKLNDSII